MVFPYGLPRNPQPKDDALASAMTLRHAPSVASALACKAPLGYRPLNLARARLIPSMNDIPISENALRMAGNP
jgi:hypothetical protein